MKITASAPQSLIASFWLIAWLVGAYLAKSFWLTLAACLFPPYAWYLVVEWVFIIFKVPT